MKIDARDLRTYEGIAMMLEGLKRIPVQVCLTIYVDDSTHIDVINLDGVDDKEREFVIHMHHDCVDCEKHVTLSCKHHSRKLALDLMDTINNPDESRLLKVLYAAEADEEII